MSDRDSLLAAVRKAREAAAPLYDAFRAEYPTGLPTPSYSGYDALQEAGARVQVAIDAAVAAGVDPYEDTTLTCGRCRQTFIVGTVPNDSAGYALAKAAINRGNVPATWGILCRRCSVELGDLWARVEATPEALARWFQQPAPGDEG